MILLVFKGRQRNAVPQFSARGKSTDPTVELPQKGAENANILAFRMNGAEERVFATFALFCGHPKSPGRLFQRPRSWHFTIVQSTFDESINFDIERVMR